MTPRAASSLAFPASLLLRFSAFLATTLLLAAEPPAPAEIPVPPLQTSLEALPGPESLPSQPGMPDVLRFDDGTRVTSPADWPKRRAELLRTLEYYHVGRMPPPPGNVRATELRSRLLLGGTVRYRLLHLAFGPDRKLGFDIGIFTPTKGGPFPTVILPGGTPPEATPLPRLPPGPTQGKGLNVLLVTGAGDAKAPLLPPPTDAEPAAARNAALAHGFACVVFNPNDCAEDTTLRAADGSWAFRTTRFFPAYPGYDWGILGAWAWGSSRVVDYLLTDPQIDETKLIITGMSRLGKAAMITGAFDNRIAVVAPVASSGLGTPAYRFSGAGRGGHEGLDEMLRKYPNQFSPHLLAFRGRVDRLPYDANGFLALTSPRLFIALEGTEDPNVSQNGVRQTFLGALPAYALFGVSHRLGISWSQRAHSLTQDDWDALFAFVDKQLFGKNTERAFDRFPTTPLNVRDFGATGDGRTKDTAALQRALDACAAKDGGELILPAGTYLSGSLQISSHTTLRFEKGSSLIGSSDLADYPVIKARWEGRWVDAHRALLSATDARDITLTGPGSISLALGGRQMPRRPCVIEMINCRNLLVEGLTLTQQGMWTLHPTFCENITFRNLTIRGTGGNSDGIDVDSCKKVLIEGCDIQTGDDCIALKSGRGAEGVREARPTEDVIIRDCSFSSALFACIGIGSETSGGIRGLRIERCKFLGAKTHAIYIKSRPGRAGVIEDISMDDCDVSLAPTSGFLRINLLNSGIQDPDWVRGDAGIPTARNFRFSNIRVACGRLVEATSISPSKPLDGLSLTCITGTATRGIALANVVNAELSYIKVAGIDGPALTLDQVTGTGLEDGVAPVDRVALWNGRDLAGWRLFTEDAASDPAEVWSVAEGGVLRLASKAKGYLRTEKAYANYRLHVEWRWPYDAPGGSNSGVLVGLRGPDAVWPQCFECQLKSGNAGQIVGMDLDIPAAPLENNRKRAAKLEASSENALGEWNSYDIYCLGDAIEVFVNGVRQNRVDGLPQTSPNEILGNIALQLEGYPIDFRNLWLQPL
jgi:hypothetical protein